MCLPSVAKRLILAAMRLSDLGVCGAGNNLIRTPFPSLPYWNLAPKPTGSKSTPSTCARKDLENSDSSSTLAAKF